MEVVNPLFNPEVLHTVFDKLDFRSLKRCRLVCKAWNGIASKKVHLVLFAKYEEHQEDSLIALTTSPSLPSFINVEVRGRFGQLISELLEMMGPNPIRCFTINVGEKRLFCKLPAGFPDLVHHAKLLMSILEESDKRGLELLEADKRNPLWPTVWKIYTAPAQKGPYMMDYIELCPNLETLLIPRQRLDSSLGLRYFLGDQQLNAPFDGDKLQTLRKINYRLFPADIQYLERLSSFSWRLTSVEIVLEDAAPIPAVRNALLQVSGTLKSLIVRFTAKQANVNGNHFQGEVSLVVPVELNNLRSLSVTSVHNKTLIAQNLVAAFQLPKLQNLSLNGVVRENAYDTMVRGRNMENLQSISLKSVEIYCQKHKFLDHNFFLRGVNPLPNIKHLKLARPTILVVCSIFRAFQQGLESLELLLEVSKGKRVIPWDSILGNTPFDPSNENFLLSTDLPDLNLPDRPCLKDLKDLKSLKIGFTLEATESICSDWKLTDHFIYNVLMELKGLQYFQATHHKFTAEALEKLRSEIHPFVNINVARTAAPDQ